MRKLLPPVGIAMVLAFLTLPLGGSDVGLSQTGLRIEAAAVPGATPTSPTVMLVGGLSGDDESVGVVARETRDFQALPQAGRQFRLLAVSLANPDRAKLQFPPTGVAYRENPESNALWRWIAIQAPDLVLVVGKEDFGLAEALSQNVVAGVGRIPAARIIDTRQGILASLPKEIAPSDARKEIQRRLSRSPLQLATPLAEVYGHDFAQITYLPGMALIGQMRLGRTADVERLAAPYLDGRNTLAGASSLTLAGHLVFAELAERTGNPRYLELARKAADTGFTETGAMKESMPYHDEMSDSVFMAIPILAKTGKLTGQRKYFDMAARHFSFMQKLVLRPDGLYRHSPLTDAAWSRGNAFPALGLALTLSDFPKDHPDYGRIAKAFQDHMTVLARFQTEDGMWREVVDHPGSYQEYSSTAMIATAMLRGIRNGWLDRATFQPRVDRAWQAILARTAPDGRLMDVCESTNKQQSLDDYLHRAAILDRDPRGGGMALIFATEMAGRD
jgi:unsaturated rhamnogalacturonyl hydrolase